MTYSFRTIRVALRQRWTLLAIVLSSLGVALLWGVNIGAVYPFFEGVFRNRSMHEWIDDRIEKTQTQCDEFENLIEQFGQQAGDGSYAGNGRQRRLYEQQLSTKRQLLATYRWLEPHFKRYLPDDARNTVIALAGFVFVGTVVKSIFLVANLYFVDKLAQRTVMELRNDLFDHVLHTELAAFHQENSGKMISHFSADAGNVTIGLTTVFGKSLREPLKILVCTLGAVWISWELLLISVIVCPLPLLLMYVLAKSIRRASHRVLAQNACFFQRLSESFRAIQVVKAYTTEAWERKRFVQATRGLYQRLLRVSVYGAMSRVNNEVLGVGVLCLALLAGSFIVLGEPIELFGGLISNLSLDLGSLMLFYGLLIGACDPVRKLADVLPMLQRAEAGAERIYQMLDCPPAIQSPVVPRQLPPPPYAITFERVGFRYRDDEPLLDNFNLEIRAHETLAIVGPNGCGKSTLANLIPRFYDPLEGAICVHGVDLRELSLDGWRRKIGWVSQQTHLFEDSVADNIRYGSFDASDEQIIAAARQAFAHQFIEEKLDQGYDTLVGEGGGRLSGGQRQRIALARAFLRDPEILVLDEATSQIDPESERLIHEALRQFIRQRTTILITHRMSTLALADRILVMDSGRIADIGTHNELIRRCRVYGDLYQGEQKLSA